MLALPGLMVPEISPVAGFRLRPGGSEPWITAPGVGLIAAGSDHELIVRGAGDAGRQCGGGDQQMRRCHGRLRAAGVDGVRNRNRGDRLAGVEAERLWSCRD